MTFIVAVSASIIELDDPIFVVSSTEFKYLMDVEQFPVSVPDADPLRTDFFGISDPFDGLIMIMIGLSICKSDIIFF